MSIRIIDNYKKISSVPGANYRWALKIIEQTKPGE
jgi:hypothetical protein